MRYAVYGEVGARDSVALVTALSAKRIDFDFVEETPDLALALAARAGRDVGPFLRTPESLILGDLHAILDYLDRLHPDPAWRPTTPVRHACARILEDWIELWLPIWPARARSILEDLARHLDLAGFLLGPTPCRPDGSLAAWLEADVLSDPELKEYLARHAPRLARYVREVRSAALGRTILSAAGPGSSPVPSSSRERARETELASASVLDDAIPISLVDVLCEIATDWVSYLLENRNALIAGEGDVEIDFGLGPKIVPVSRTCEERRVALGRDLAGLSRDERRAVRQMLEPLGLWQLLSTPPAIDPFPLADPRSL